MDQLADLQRCQVFVGQFVPQVMLCQIYEAPNGDVWVQHPRFFIVEFSTYEGCLYWLAALLVTRSFSPRFSPELYAELNAHRRQWSAGFWRS